MSRKPSTLRVGCSAGELLNPAGVARHRDARLSIAVAAVLLFPPKIVGAETLQEALTSAYRTNPVLQSQRDQQRALDETYVQAKAGWRATAAVTTQAQYERQPNNLANATQGSTAANLGSAAITLSQPLYTGGRTTWAIRQADAAVRSGREGLRAVEEQVLFSVVQGYLDVLRDQRILAIRDADIATLQRQSAEANARFNLGQVTRTDVAQAEAQLEAARGGLAAATGALEVSRAEFEAAVGEPPGVLAEPGNLPGIPASLAEAMTLAERFNPILLESRLKEQSSRAAIAVAKAGWRPTVTLQGSFGYIGPLTTPNIRDYGQEAIAGVTLTVPLLTAGLVSSQVRQAAAQNSSDEVGIEIARRQVVQSVAQSWSQLQANRLGVAAAQAQEKAADLALRGVQLEYGYGLRTTLDVLIVDENLRSAQLSLATSRHDASLAEAEVLSASGRLQVSNLLPTEPTYDPEKNFDRVKNAGRAPWEGTIETLDRIAAPPP